MIKATDQNLAPGFWDSVGNAAMESFRILKVRDFGLFDFRVHKESGMAYLLEANLFCSFGEKSVLTSMAREDGYTDRELLNMFVRRAMSRRGEGTVSVVSDDIE